VILIPTVQFSLIARLVRKLTDLFVTPGIQGSFAGFTVTLPGETVTKRPATPPPSQTLWGGTYGFVVQQSLVKSETARRCHHVSEIDSPIEEKGISALIETSRAVPSQIWTSLTPTGELTQICSFSALGTQPKVPLWLAPPLALQLIAEPFRSWHPAESPLMVNPPSALQLIAEPFRSWHPAESPLMVSPYPALQLIAEPFRSHVLSRQAGGSGRSSQTNYSDTGYLAVDNMSISSVQTSHDGFIAAPS